MRGSAWRALPKRDADKPAEDEPARYTDIDINGSASEAEPRGQCVPRQSLNRTRQFTHVQRALPLAPT